MNKDRVKGTLDEMMGSAKRKTGELTGDTLLEVKGMAQQVKGKVENAWGKAEDAVLEANKEAEVHHDTRIAVELKVAALEDEQPTNRY
jgi:uncharacterized protein YjbJ (UPF0337 family)